MSRIVGIRRDETGSISDYKLDDGQIISRDEAVKATDEGKIEGCSTFTTRNGDMAIRSDRGQENYSLNDLPEF